MEPVQEDASDEQQGEQFKGPPAHQAQQGRKADRTLDSSRRQLDNGKRTLDRSRRPLDGGWGWMCVLGCAITQIVFGTNIRSFGVIYLTLRERYGASATATAWVGAINFACTGSFGPIVSALCRRFGCRRVTITGAMMTTVGVIATGYAPNIYITFVTYGLIGGAGLCMTTTAGFIIVGQYFGKRKALAMSLSHFSGGIGALVSAPVLLILFEAYSFTGMILILGGICLHTLISAALYRPLMSNITSMDPIHIDARPTEGNHNRQSQNVSTSTPVKQQELPEEPEISLSTRYSNMIRNPCFISLTFVIFSVNYAVSLNSAYLPALAIDNGIDETRAALLLSICGVAGMVGTLSMGPVLDLQMVRPYRPHIYNSFNVLLGSAMLLQAVAASYTSSVVLAILSIASAGILMSQRPTIIGDLVGRRSDAEGLGVVLMVSALAMLLGRVMAGVIKDARGAYNAAYSLSGSICLLTSAIFEVVLLRTSLCQVKNQKQVLQENTPV